VSVFIFRTLRGFADGFGQARLGHLLRDVGEGRPGVSVLLGHLLCHARIMSWVGRRERSIQTRMEGNVLRSGEISKGGGRYAGRCSRIKRLSCEQSGTDLRE